jgi:hypothetical protein
MVNSGDQRHLQVGTEVRALGTRKEAFQYARSYAKKGHMKAVPDSFSVVPALGVAAYGSLTESLV